MPTHQELAQEWAELTQMSPHQLQHDAVRVVERLQELFKAVYQPESAAEKQQRENREAKAQEAQQYYAWVAQEQAQGRDPFGGQGQQPQAGPAGQYYQQPPVSPQYQPQQGQGLAPRPGLGFAPQQGQGFAPQPGQGFDPNALNVTPLEPGLPQPTPQYAPQNPFTGAQPQQQRPGDVPSIVATGPYTPQGQPQQPQGPYPPQQYPQQPPPPWAQR